MNKHIKSYIKDKKGMSLVEVLTAMSILTLVIFCFAPLMLSYLETINISGDKMERVYRDAGNLESLIGKNSRDRNYTVSIDTVPIKLTSPTATIDSQTVQTATIESFVKAYGLTSGGTFAKDQYGNPSEDGKINISTGQSTFYTDKTGSSSGITLFPSSLTDDFKVAYITIFGSGIDFVLSQCEFVTMGLSSEIQLTKGVDYDLEYHPDAQGTEYEKCTLLLTVYGGGDKISFETSPLVFKHMGHRYEIQIDAPQMIMVGEKSAVTDDDGNEYHYYVLRGELEELDGENHLLIHRRAMKTTNDPRDSSVSSNSPTTLTSAMNDVEWVPASSADEKTWVDKNNDGKVTEDEKYGYYVMCGDNGQIRRFWKRSSRTMVVDGKEIEVDGNYYWGGDYTYYTDYNLNRFDSGGTYIRTEDKNGNPSTEKVYGTDTSFQYIAMRPMYWSEGETADKNRFRTGFNMSSKKYLAVQLGSLVEIHTGTAHLRNLCTVSATYGDNVEFYGSDGKLFPYVTNNVVTNPNSTSDCDKTIDIGAVTDTTPAYKDIENWQTSSGSYKDRTVEATSSLGLLSYNNNEAWGWLDPGDGTSSYYRIYGLTDDSGKTTVNTKSYPITLTSVDAICITGQGGVYETNVTDTSKSHYFTSGIINDTDTSGDATRGSNSGASGTTSTNLEYPMSNYVLYCGYIPAYMDAWASVTGGATYPYKYEFAGDNGQYAKVWNYDANQTNVGQNSKIGRASNRLNLGDNAEYNPIWRMTMGITPFVSGSNPAVDEGENKGYIGYQHTKDSKTTTVVYYPYTNLSYAITGKYYDNLTYTQNKDEINALFPGTSKGLSVSTPNLLTSFANDRQNYTTAGKVIDITISYLSHPLAISIAANPTDDVVYDYSNNKDGGQVYYWHNRRESITFLDSASTMVPAGENDIPVSLMVGYVLGGTVFYGTKDSAASVDVTSVMNNGIVFLRAGSYNIGKHSALNSETNELKATDNTGYKLDQESNVFHQFYYLNSRTTSSADPSKGSHIGNLYGANYWQNNQHIIPRSITGPAPTTGNDSSNTEYLRAHPLSDTKVTCVAWGTTWDGKPEAMWGTENGTVLSWAVDTIAAKNTSDASTYNDRSVVAEFQAYTWIDTVNNNAFYVAPQTSKYYDTVGVNGKYEFNANNRSKFAGFYDAKSRQYGVVDALGFVSTLVSINDVCFANDTWVAVGDQSNKNPEQYCATAGLDTVKGTQKLKAFSNSGSGSWVNVRYWTDYMDTDKHTTDNNYYLWKAVKISDKLSCNIVQINYVNGMWIATGYQDGYKDGQPYAAWDNDEYDDGEQTVICWTYNPLIPYGEEGGWSDKVIMYDGDDSRPLSEMGGINSCATRD